eukprot:365630-Chlamydomonas_euryale.AAC.35
MCANRDLRNHAQFLGWLYRELKNSVVDIEEFVDIMATQSRIKDGTVVLPELAPSLVAGYRLPAKQPGAGSGNGNGSGAARSAADGVSNGHVAGATSTAAAAAGVEIELDNVTFSYSEGRQVGQRWVGRWGSDGSAGGAAVNSHVRQRWVGRWVSGEQPREAAMGRQVGQR